MSRERIICVVLLCLSSGTSSAQEEPDLSALTFTLGPGSDEVLLAPPSEDELAPTDRELEDGERGRLRESVQELTESISAEEALNGSWSTGLIEPLTSLAATYQALGEDILTLGALERAKQVVRRNEGLHSLGQASIVDQMIEIMENTGQLGASAALQSSLLELALQNERDSRAPSVLAGVAARQMAAVEEYLDTKIWPEAREFPPGSDSTGWEPSTPRVGRHLAAPRLGEILNDYDAAIETALVEGDHGIVDPLASEAALAETSRLIDTVNDFVEEGPLPRGDLWEPEPPTSDRGWALAALRRARRLYNAAAQMLVKIGNGGYATGEYRALEDQLVETYYLELAHPELHSDTIGNPEGMVYLTGKAALEAKVIEKLAQRASPVEVASALIGLADWELFFSINGPALQKYQEAYDYVVEKDVPVETIADLFSPDTPAIVPPPASASAIFDPARRYRGYLDVSIETGRYGQSMRVDILDASVGVSGALERRLRKHIGEHRFRPRFVDGRASRAAKFSLRYYFDY